MVSQVQSRASWGWIITAVAVAGIGFMAWNALGPDLRRYIKMSNM